MIKSKVRARIVAGFVIASLGVAATFADTLTVSPATQATATMPAIDPFKIAVLLKGSDKEALAQGLQVVQDQLASDSSLALRNLRTYWLPALMDGKHYDETLDCASRGINARPFQTSAVVFMQKFRVQALRKAGRNEEALSEAKAFFNIVELKDSGGAMLALAECFEKCGAEGKQRAEKFKLEQEAGAGAENGKTSPTLSAVALNSKRYDSAIDEWSLCTDPTRIGEPTLAEIRHHQGKANLLLLAGRASEAKKELEAAISLATDGKAQLAASIDVARAIKAEDGTIGRANAYVLSQTAVNKAKGE